MNKSLIVSPIFVGLAGIFTFLFIHIFAPIRPKVSLGTDTLIYILASYTLFFLGCTFFYFMPKTHGKKLDIDSSGLGLVDKKMINTAIFLAVIGVIFRLIDRFYLRNVSIFQSAMENRELLEEGSGGLLSILGALIYPICFISLFLFLKHRGRFFSFKGMLVVILFFFPTFDSFLFGSRSLILVNVLMLLLILHGTEYVKIRFIQVFYVSLGGIILIGLSGHIFLSRLEEMGLNVLDSIYISGYATTVAPNEWVADHLSQGLSFSNTLLFSWLNFAQYYTHGLYEFNNFLHLSVSEHSYGALQFNIIYKFFEKLTSIPSLEVVLDGVNPRPGVFTTFFGPSHMDFGFFSPLLMFFWGAVAAWIHRKVSYSGSYYAVLYYMCVIIIFFFPVVNFIQSAQGLYIISSVVFFDLIYRLLSKFPKIRIKQV